MKLLKPQFVAAVGARAISAGVVAAGLILGLGSKRKIELYSCSSDQDIEYILKSGPEYLIVNPSRKWGRNSYLVSKETNSIPKNWLLLGMSIEKADNKEFELNASNPNAYIGNIIFKHESLGLEVKYGAKGVKPWKAICKPSAQIAKVQTAANNIPVEYLMERRNNLSFLNPSLGQKNFNLFLYNAIKTKEHSTYGIYQLLSGLTTSTLTGNENLIMQAAREDLIKANSSEFQIWEFAGTYRYNWQISSESNEANMNAGTWCREQQYSNVAAYTAEGFKVVSSSPEVRSTVGWIRRDYPDGRFSGFVNYRAECDGVTYTLKKEGSVDNENENDLRQYN
ncbi:hypothetical protein KBY58_00295 [Cyanobium sp. HWJ4-Hawea]|uniref:hypothetical protein n=1 Tax=Cyanobium sp. HWJ4-Hawea TaxID=2823713 RepID=UPI0020CE129B|nr:hypothetical protein [Cyanobium sp. HWJ4-Hawea]MCP9807875.1 hypothetical protein [Cyanobium sp. HWJ4-Hawea]